MDKTAFTLGCNYWASHKGLYMWREWDASVVKKDMEFLAENGVRVIRAFPLWPDFQPLEWQSGTFCGMIMHGSRLKNDRLGKAGIDKTMTDRFGLFLDFAEMNGISVIVGLLTGWMSGKSFVPSAFTGRNVITDPFAMVWEQRFVRAFVHCFKNHKAVLAWDLGNECNVLGGSVSREQALVWTQLISDAIRTEDPVGVVISGMHSLSIDGSWRITDQGECCDMLTVHPYPEFTPYCNIEDIGSMRSILHLAAEASMYGDISGKPCMAEECGTLGPMAGDMNRAALYTQKMLLSSLAYGTTGFLWWCAFDQKHLDFSPYTDCALERELGFAACDYKVKPLLEKIKAFGEKLDKINCLPSAEYDGVCVLTPGQDHWGAAYASFVLAVQAGIRLKFITEENNLPDAMLYFMPSISGGGGLVKDKFDKIIENVKNGAILYLSCDNGYISRFSELTGLTIAGRSVYGNEITSEIDGVPHTFRRNTELTVIPCGAEVLYADGERILFSRFKLGKGTVFFLNAPMETDLVRKKGLFDMDYYKIYRTVAQAQTDFIITGKPKTVGATIHRDGGEIYAFFIAYDDCETAEIHLAGGYAFGESLFGSAEDGCIKFDDSGCLVRLIKE